MQGANLPKFWKSAFRAVWKVLRKFSFYENVGGIVLFDLRGVNNGAPPPGGGDFAVLFLVVGFPSLR